MKSSIDPADATLETVGGVSRHSTNSIGHTTHWIKAQQFLVKYKGMTFLTVTPRPKFGLRIDLPCANLLERASVSAGMGGVLLRHIVPLCPEEFIRNTSPHALCPVQFRASCSKDAQRFAVFDWNPEVHHALTRPDTNYKDYAKALNSLIVSPPAHDM